MASKRRTLSALMAAGYLLATTTAAFFHDHACSERAGCGAVCYDKHAHGPSHHSRHDATQEEGHPAPITPDRHTDGAKCSICQFLAQASAPVGPVAPLLAAPLVQAITTVSPSFSLTGVFTAWHSRAPPAVA
jgi:hypothetical protein